MKRLRTSSGWSLRASHARRSRGVAAASRGDIRDGPPFGTGRPGDGPAWRRSSLRACSRRSDNSRALPVITSAGNESRPDRIRAHQCLCSGHPSQPAHPPSRPHWSTLAVISHRRLPHGPRTAQAAASTAEGSASTLRVPVMQDRQPGQCRVLPKPVASVPRGSNRSAPFQPRHRGTGARNRQPNQEQGLTGQQSSSSSRREVRAAFLTTCRRG